LKQFCLKAYLNGNLLLFGLYFILFCINFLFGLILIIKAGLSLYKVLTENGSNNKSSKNPTNTIPSAGEGSFGNNGPSSGGTESTGQDTRNNTEDNSSWDEFFNYPSSEGFKSEGEPEPHKYLDPESDPDPDGEVEQDEVTIAEIEKDVAFLA
jgi:hypothetical protein